MKQFKYGKGQRTIILLHGGPSLYGYMMSLGEYLIDDFQVIDYAQKGTHENPATDEEEVNLENHIKDLDEIVSSIDEKPILIGHSWGANLALLYAAQYSSKIEKVVCLGTASLSEEIGDLFSERFSERLTELDKTKLENINRRLEDAKSSSRINEIMNERLAITSPLYHFERETEEKLPKCKWEFDSFQDSIDSLWDFIEEGGIPGELAKITCPVLVFHGDKDVFPPTETFEFLETNISNIKTFLIEKSGHFPWLEKNSSELLKLLRSEL